MPKDSPFYKQGVKLKPLVPTDSVLLNGDGFKFGGTLELPKFGNESDGGAGNIDTYNIKYSDTAAEGVIIKHGRSRGTKAAPLLPALSDTAYARRIYLFDGIDDFQLGAEELFEVPNTFIGGPSTSKSAPLTYRLRLQATGGADGIGAPMQDVLLINNDSRNMEIFGTYLTQNNSGIGTSTGGTFIQFNDTNGNTLYKNLIWSNSTGTRIFGAPTRLTGGSSVQNFEMNWFRRQTSGTASAGTVTFNGADIYNTLWTPDNPGRGGVIQLLGGANYSGVGWAGGNNIFRGGSFIDGSLVEYLGGYIQCNGATSSNSGASPHIDGGKITIQTGRRACLSTPTYNYMVINPNGGEIVAGDDTTVESTAKLQVNSTTQGFLPPRMTTTERNNITSPADGLMIFNTTTAQWEGYDGSSWVIIG